MYIAILYTIQYTYFNRSVKAIIVLYRTIKEFSGQYNTRQNKTGPYRIIPEYTGLYMTKYNYTGIYWTIQD